MNLCNIGIINIGFTGNIYSIHKAIEYAGGKVGLIKKPSDFNMFDKII